MPIYDIHTSTVHGRYFEDWETDKSKAIKIAISIRRTSSKYEDPEMPHVIVTRQYDGLVIYTKRYLKKALNKR